MADGYPLRMRDLVRLTGASAATIHFYAQQGLLPPSQKTAGNQARYPESTVRRVGTNLARGSRPTGVGYLLAIGQVGTINPDLIVGLRDIFVSVFAISSST